MISDITKDLRFDSDELYEIFGYSMYLPNKNKVITKLAELRKTVNESILIYHSKNKVLGVVAFHFINKSIVIDHIAVSVKNRNQKIASNLIDNLAYKNNYSSIEAETDDSSVGFYRSYGFQIENLGEKYPGTIRYKCIKYK